MDFDEIYAARKKQNKIKESASIGFDEIYNNRKSSVIAKPIKEDVSFDDIYNFRKQNKGVSLATSVSPYEESKTLKQGFNETISNVRKKPSFGSYAEAAGKFISSAWASVWSGLTNIDIVAGQSEMRPVGTTLPSFREQLTKAKTGKSLEEIKAENTKKMGQTLNKVLTDVWTGKTSGVTGTLRDTIYKQTDGGLDIGFGLDKDKITFSKPGEIPDSAIVAKDRQGEWLEKHPGVTIHSVTPIKANALAKATMYGLAAYAEIVDPIGNAAFNKIGQVIGKALEYTAVKPLSFVGKTAQKTAAYNKFINLAPVVKAGRYLEDVQGVVTSKLATKQANAMSFTKRITRAFTGNNSESFKLETELLSGEAPTYRSKRLMSAMDVATDTHKYNPDQNEAARDAVHNVLKEFGITTTKEETNSFIDLTMSLKSLPFEKRQEVLSLAGMSLDPGLFVGKENKTSSLIADAYDNFGENEVLQAQINKFKEQRTIAQQELKDTLSTLGLDPEKHYSMLVNHMRMVDEAADNADEYAGFMEKVFTPASDIPKMDDVHPMALMIPDWAVYDEATQNKINYLLHEADKIYPYNNDLRRVTMNNYIATVPVWDAAQKQFKEAIATTKSKINSAESFSEIQNIVAKSQFKDTIVHNISLINGIVDNLNASFPKFGDAVAAEIAANPEALIQPQAFKASMNRVVNKFVDDTLKEDYRIMAPMPGDVGLTYDHPIYQAMRSDATYKDMITAIKDQIKNTTDKNQKLLLKQQFIDNIDVATKKQISDQARTYYNSLVGDVTEQLKSVIDTGLGKAEQTSFDTVVDAYNRVKSLNNAVGTRDITSKAGVFTSTDMLVKNKLVQKAVADYVREQGYDVGMIEKLTNYYADKQQMNALAQNILDKIPADVFMTRDGMHLPRSYAVLNMEQSKRVKALEDIKVNLQTKLDEATTAHQNAIEIADEEAIISNESAVKKYTSYVKEIDDLITGTTVNDVSLSSGIATHGLSGQLVYKHLSERSHISDELAGMLGVIDNIMIAGSGSVAKFGTMTNTAKGLLYNILDNTKIDGESLIKSKEEINMLSASERSRYYQLNERFGVLNGKYAPNFIYKHLEDMTNVHNPGLVVRGIEKATGWMKAGVLATMPFVLRNTGSNSIAMMLATGEDFPRIFKEGLQAFADINYKAVIPDAVIEDLEEYSRYSSSMRRSLSQMYDQLPDDVLSMPFSMSKWDKVKEFALHVNQRTTGALTNHQEQSAKLAIFRILKSKGVKAADAVAAAEKWMIDYGDVAPMVGALRRVFAPFITYPTKMAPLLAKNVVENPGKTLEMYGKFWRAQNATTNRELFRQEMENSPDRVSGFGKFMFKLPSGQMFDLAYFIPHNIFSPQFDPSEPGATAAIKVFAGYLNPVITKIVQLYNNKNSNNQTIFEHGDNALDTAASVAYQAYDLFPPQWITRALIPTLGVVTGSPEPSMKDQEFYSRWLGTRHYKFDEDLGREIKKINGQLIEKRRVLAKRISELGDIETKTGPMAAIQLRQKQYDINKLNGAIETLEAKRFEKDRKAFNLEPLRILGIKAGLSDADMSAFEYYFMTHRDDIDTHANLQRYLDGMNGKITFDHLTGIPYKYTDIPKAPGVNIPKYSNIPKYMPRPNTEVMSEATKGMQPNKEFSNPRVKDVNQP